MQGTSLKHTVEPYGFPVCMNWVTPLYKLKVISPAGGLHEASRYIELLKEFLACLYMESH